MSTPQRVSILFLVALMAGCAGAQASRGSPTTRPVIPAECLALGVTCPKPVYWIGEPVIASIVAKYICDAPLTVDAFSIQDGHGRIEFRARGNANATWTARVLARDPCGPIESSSTTITKGQLCIAQAEVTTCPAGRKAPQLAGIETAGAYEVRAVYASGSREVASVPFPIEIRDLPAEDAKVAAAAFGDLKVPTFLFVFNRTAFADNHHAYWRAALRVVGSTASGRSVLWERAMLFLAQEDAWGLPTADGGRSRPDFETAQARLKELLATKGISPEVRELALNAAKLFRTQSAK